MSSFAANFQGLELHSKTIKFRKVIVLFTNAKTKAKRIQGLHKYILFEYNGKKQYCENSKGQCAHVYTSFYLCLQGILPRSGHDRFDKHLIPKI